MAIHTITIRVYTGTGEIDGSLSPVISILETSGFQEVLNAPMTWDVSLKKYVYNFQNFDITKIYSCDVFFGASALTKYVNFNIGNGGESVLTPTEKNLLEQTLKQDNIIINADDILIPV